MTKNTGHETNSCHQDDGCLQGMKDLRWLNSFPQAIKIAVKPFVVGVLFLNKCKLY